MRLPSQTFAQSIAAEVRAMCAIKQVRQTEVAHKAGMSQAAFSVRVRGQRAFDLDQLDRICRALDVEVDELLARARARMAA